MEELGDNKEPKEKASKSFEKIDPLLCSNPKCKKEVKAEVADYSKRFWDRILCRDCQDTQKKSRKLEDMGR